MHVHVSPGAAVSRQHVRKLLRQSFQFAQGDQPTQCHFVAAYARQMVLEGVQLDYTAREDLLDWVRRQRLPAGHMPIPDVAQRRAQFEFWWELIWDTLIAVYTGNPGVLPSRAELDDRMLAMGGTADMSSFSDAEMAALARTVGLYRRCTLDLGLPVVIEQLLLPSIIRVETGFQGGSTRYPCRPRTDGGDVHESKLLRQAEHALAQYRLGKADLVDRIYRQLCARLSELAETDAEDSVYAAYRDLVPDYNRNHPDAEPLTALHVPLSRFPATLRSSAPV